jgi:hypothetical protein
MQRPRAQAHRVRELVAFALLACACGVATRAGTTRGAAARGGPVPVPAPGDAGETAIQGGASEFQAIEAAWAPFVPGMRRVATAEGGAEKLELVRASEQDTCVRVAFEASEPVVASLVEAAGATLASTTERTRGLLAEYGPVCVRKGDAVHALATGPATARVRWVAWAAR